MLYISNKPPVEGARAELFKELRIEALQALASANLEEGVHFSTVVVSEPEVPTLAGANVDLVVKGLKVDDLADALFNPDNLTVTRLNQVLDTVHTQKSGWRKANVIVNGNSVDCKRTNVLESHQ